VRLQPSATPAEQSCIGCGEGELLGDAGTWQLGRFKDAQVPGW